MIDIAIVILSAILTAAIIIAGAVGSLLLVCVGIITAGLLIAAVVAGLCLLARGRLA